MFWNMLKFTTYTVLKWEFLGLMSVYYIGRPFPDYLDGS